ncbi:conjugal transfer protein TraG [Novosphingobium resinovorum]|uniref:conjugal transfer protein TraG n=1 Tax=Novosphingobium resinovorum TaxID=158500 RepID=UPI0009F3BA06|nr:conjugal transfer protein TraG [Novosphingobium resinovorum]
MTPTKLLVGQFLVVLAIILAGVWFATQWVAASLAYQSELGAPWFRLGDMPIYHPWLLFVWWFEFEAYAPRVFDEAGSIAAASGLVGCAAAVFGSVWRARQRGDVTTYGSARWAQRGDLRRAGLLSDQGVFLGRVGSRYLRHDGPEHIMAFAPTRSGKGVGLVVPSLLGWTGSAIVHDIKGENWKLTAGWRSRFSHCLLFNPTDPRSARYNPLLEVRRGIDEVRDVQNIADILVDPEGALERRGHWEKTGHALLVGAILHVLYAQADKTLAGVARLLSDPSRPFEATLRAMMATNHLGTEADPCVHPVVAAAAREVLNKSVNERSGVLSTAMSFLSLYRDPTVSAVTGASDWRIADIVAGPNPVSLYLVVPPSDISRTKPLIRLILNQIGRRLTEDLPEPDPARRPDRHRLLMMLDEFPALGRLDFFETSLAFLAGYGVRAFLIAQSLNQIEKAYGDHNSILDNCHVRVAFATNDERTAKRISDALGTATEQRAMRNYAGHRLAPWLAHVMVSRQETARALLTPGEVMQLPANDEIVMLSGAPPVRATKLRYYRDPTFAGCVLAPPALAASGYQDLPPPRGNDWTGRLSGTDGRLAAVSADDAEEGDANGHGTDKDLTARIGAGGGAECSAKPAIGGTHAVSAPGHSGAQKETATANTGAVDRAVTPDQELPAPPIAAAPERDGPGTEEDEGDLAAERRQIVRIEQQRNAQTQVVRVAYALDVSDGRAEELELGF